MTTKHDGEGLGDTPEMKRLLENVRTDPAVRENFARIVATALAEQGITKPEDIKWDGD